MTFVGTTAPRALLVRLLLAAGLVPAGLVPAGLVPAAAAAPRLTPPPPVPPATPTDGGRHGSGRKGAGQSLSEHRGSEQQGDRVVINGQSQQARWLWTGGGAGQSSALWLPLEVLQNQLGVSSRSRPDGSLDLEWFGQPLLVPPGEQRSLDDEVSLDALPLLTAVGVQLEASDGILRLTLPEAQLVGVRSGSQPEGRRVVLDLATPALVRGNGPQFSLDLRARPDQLAQLQELGLVVRQESRGLNLRARSGTISRMFTLGGPNRVVVDLPGGGSSSGSGTTTAPAPIDPAVQALIGRSLRWDRLVRGSVRINAIRLDPRTAPLQLRPLVRPGGMEGLTSLVQLAGQTNARVAINGGYFNRVRRLPLGALKLDGRWMSGPILNRGVAAWSGRALPRFGRLRLEDWVVAPDGQRLPIVVTNSGYVQRGVSVYTAAWGSAYRALSGSETALLVQPGGQVSRVYGSGELEQGVPLPPGHTLLVGRGGVSLPWTPGSRLQLTSRASSPLGQESQVIGGGPLLLQDGRIVLNGAAENFSASFMGQGAPRTVLGSDGREIWLVTLEGAGGSGPTLAQAAQLLLELGLRDALNLDGGSSTGLVLGGSHLVKGRGVAGSVHNGVGLVP